MAIDLSILSVATTTATALSNLILVNPQDNVGIQPQADSIGLQTEQLQVPKFLFNYEGENTVLLESDITDHFVEDNTAIQDQIALRPEIITTHGFIAELNDIGPEILAPLKLAADKLTVIDAYTPVISATAILAYNEAVQLYAVAQLAKNSAVNAWQTVSTGAVPATQNKQQLAFQQFYGYWQNRTLFTVQTPWAIFRNMAIKSLRAIQDADTRVITDFEISFKMMRFAQTIVTSNTQNQFQGRAKSQAASLVDNGTSTPVASLGLNTELSSAFTGSF